MLTASYRAYSFRAEGQPVQRLVEEAGQNLDHQIVVIALRQARNGDGADDAGILDMDGEAAAMGCEIQGRDTAMVIERVLLGEELAPDPVGALEVTQHHVALAPHPFGIIGGASGKRRVEELPRAEADIDDDRQPACLGQIAEFERPSSQAAFSSKDVKRSTSS